MIKLFEVARRRCKQDSPTSRRKYITILNSTLENLILKFKGFPREEENICQITFELAEVIDADILEEDVDNCHRLYKGEGKASPIIVQFKKL